MHPIFTEAYLLRSVRYGESDVVATLLSPSLGAVGVLARGARKSQRRFGAALDFFNLLRAEVRPSRAGMGTLSNVELIRSFARPREDMAAYEAGFHFLELANLAVRENDTALHVFNLLGAALEGMEGGAEVYGLSRWFEIRLIAILGYSLGGERCSCCHAGIDGGARYVDYAPLCVGCAGGRGLAVSPGARKTLVAAQGERSGGLRISRAIASELSDVVEGALERALGARVKTRVSPG